VQSKMGHLLWTFVFLGLIFGSWGAYDENLARYDLFPMASSAYFDHPELCVKENFKNSSFMRHIVIQCDQEKEDTCSGFTAVTYSDKAIIITFRGSTNLEVLEEVLDEVFKNRTPFPGGGSVSAYFYQAFLDIWNGGVKDDFLTLKNANPDFELWITGHSLGAAMASLCAGYIAYTGYFPVDKIKLVTYGQPRVGDGTYAGYIDNTLPYTYRVVHKADIVPHLPPIWLEMGDDLKNYTHHKSEVWYNNDMAVGQTYVECDVNESNQCSDQLEGNLLDLSIADHDVYFDLSTGFAENGCPGYNPNGAGSKRHKFVKTL